MGKSRKGFSAAAMMLIGVLLLFANISFAAEASGRTVSIDSCLISGTEVICQISASKVPASDDGFYYVYSDEVWEDGTVGEIVAQVSAGSTAVASFPLNYNTPDSQLSRKFLIAVKQGGRMVQVSNEHYITNPEAMAGFTSPRMEVGIKGILPDALRMDGTDYAELGIQQVAYNMHLDLICSSEEVPGAILFEYNGKPYYFDGGIMQMYDNVVKIFNYQGIAVHMVILNEGTGEYSKDLIHPLAQGGDCPGYALNVADEEGTDHLKAIAAFLGQRYSGKMGFGQVDNWVLGNEINARTSWWYTKSDSLDLNVNIYAKAFRIFYNELKSMNANYRIYTSLDQEWNRKSNPGSFLSREYLDQFNYYMLREGNIDWSLSFHPYNSPLYDAYAWNGPADWVKTTLKTPYMTMQNLDLLIDYMHQPEFLNPAGEVRSISLGEIGYTSSFGDAAQEASIAYGYLKAASLPDVDSFILFRQTDNAHEMKSYLAMGLIDLEGNKKPAYDIYKYLGTENEGIAIQRASEIIGMDVTKMVNEKIIWTRTGDGVISN